MLLGSGRREEAGGMAVNTYLPYCRALVACMLSLSIFAHAHSSLDALNSGGQAAGAGQAAHRALLQTAPASSQCARSWLGYQCTQLVCGPKGRIRMHWSLGGPPPGQGCSYLTEGSSTQAAAMDAASKVLHVALQTDITGYVAMSWPSRFGYMAPADGIIGFMGKGDGAPSVQAYTLEGMMASKVNVDTRVRVNNTHVEQNDTALTVCFSRYLEQPGTLTGIEVSPSQLADMNFVASSAAFPAIHELRPAYICSTRLALLQEVGGPDDGGWRPSNVTGPQVDTVAMFKERLGYMRSHGALMFTGWVVLVPLGILAARHRWLFAPLASQLPGMWFHSHRVVQAAAIVLIFSGFMLPWTTFDSADVDGIQGHLHSGRKDSLLDSHETLAYILMSVLLIHIVVAVARPKPDAPRRWLWNLVHWWTGRALALLAVVNVCLGISLWRRVSGGTGVEWLVPLVLFGVGWAALALWLELRAPPGRGLEGSTHLLGQGGSSSSAGDLPMSSLSASSNGTAAGPYNRL